MIFPFSLPRSEEQKHMAQSSRNKEGDFEKGKQPLSSLAGVHLGHKTYKLYIILNVASWEGNSEYF